MNGLFEWAGEVVPSSHSGAWSPIERGGSDRTFWRGGGSAAGLVAIHYGTDKAENARYAACAEFLQARGVSVPAVLGHDPQRRFLLLEDAGGDDLWAHRGAEWSQRREFYRRALAMAARLHAIDLGEAEAADVLQSPFDESLYRWEQEYFREHFLRAAFPPEVREALDEQAWRLAALPRVPLHRDFQSQNILVRGPDVCLIDFQGMRAGLAGYDVASLLLDPYVEMTAAERAELSTAYAQMAGRAGDPAWPEEFRACARQRLMQALGAYGFLGRVKGRPHFLSHIPAAAARLAAVCEDDPAWRPLGQLVAARAALKEKTSL
jgi:aminoglycoside/choline kinase family phosphotransferase